MMNNTCAWLDSKAGDYFADRLSGRDRERIEQHSRECPECARLMSESPDLAVRQVLQHRLGVARAAAAWSPRPRLWKLAFAGTFAGVAVVLAAGALLRPGTEAPPPLPTVAAAPAPVATPAPSPLKEKAKVNEDLPIERAKPDEAVVPDAPPASTNTPVAGSGDFAIVDAAGYSASLETYRGKVLLFAVVSAEQPEAVRQLQRLHADLGANPGVRILGVAAQRDTRLPGATFPLFYNQGSRLLGVKAGEFLLADTTGKARQRGPLTDERVAGLRTQLEQLGIR